MFQQKPHLYLTVHTKTVFLLYARGNEEDFFRNGSQRIGTEGFGTNKREEIGIFSNTVPRGRGGSDIASDNEKPTALEGFQWDALKQGSL